MSHRIPFKVCPLCEGRHKPMRSDDCTMHPAYNPDMPPKINWVECLSCGHVFTDGYFSPSQNTVLFSKTYEGQTPFLDFERQRWLSARMVDKIVRHISPSGTWLDVGFGNASLLLTAQEYGFRPIGLDLRPAAVEALKKFGMTAYCCEIMDVKERGVSVVSMADVLEHMPFPIEALVAAKQILRPDGALFLSMPAYNCDSWRLSDLMVMNPYWQEVEHYHNFSRERLYALLEDNGFKPVSYGVSERWRLCMEVCAVPNA